MGKKGKKSRMNDGLAKREIDFHLADFVPSYRTKMKGKKSKDDKGVLREKWILVGRDRKTDGDRYMWRCLNSGAVYSCRTDAFWT